MKKNILFITLCLTLFCGDAYGKTLKIKNDTNENMTVSFGHKPGQLTTFIVRVHPKGTLEVNNWSIEGPTLIFVNNVTAQEGDHWFDEGYVYKIAAGKTVDVKYREFSFANRELRSNSFFLSNKDIEVWCFKGEWKRVEDSGKIMDTIGMDRGTEKNPVPCRVFYNNSKEQKEALQRYLASPAFLSK